MKLHSTRWTDWAGRGALAALLLCGQIAQAAPPPAICGPGDSCIASPQTYGWYPTRWRRWAGTEVAQAAQPAKAKDAKSSKKPATETPSPSPEPESARPEVDESLPTPPLQPRLPDVDLPPKMPDLPNDNPPSPQPPGDVPATPEEMPTELAPPKQPLAPPQQPIVAPPTPQPHVVAPPAVDLQQPSLDDDLRRLLPEDKIPPKRDKKKTEPPRKKPPAKSRVKEDPFIDELIPGEPPPAPRQGRRQPANSAADAELSDAVFTPSQSDPEQSDEIGAAVPASLFQLENARENSRQPLSRSTLDTVDRGAADRPAAKPPAPGRENPLRRVAPVKFGHVRAASFNASNDESQPAGQRDAGGPLIANPLR